MGGGDVVRVEERTSQALRPAPPGERVLARVPSRRVRVLDAAVRADRAEWLAAWRSWPGREVMAHPDYAPLFARPEDRVVAVLAEGPGATVLFPLVLRPLGAEPWAARGEDRWDAITPYGYGGPFAWGERGGVPGFWRDYGAWCREARVVTTFARLSLFPDQLAPVEGRVEVRGPNVVVPLAGGIDAVWRGYDRDVRRRLRVARREGLAVELDPGGARVGEFHEVYAHTMERRGADAFYRFRRGFFERLAAALSGQLLFVHALSGARVVSSELVLVSAHHAYSFLGGTRSDAFRLYPNELVRHAAAEWAAGQRKARLVLGGGRSGEDGVYRHKRLHAPAGDVPFRTAALVHDEAGCQALARRRAGWEASRGVPWTPAPGFFPIYRA